MIGLIILAVALMGVAVFLFVALRSAENDFKTVNEAAQRYQLMYQMVNDELNALKHQQKKASPPLPIAPIQAQPPSFSKIVPMHSLPLGRFLFSHNDVTRWMDGTPVDPSKMTAQEKMELDEETERYFKYIGRPSQQQFSSFLKSAAMAQPPSIPASIFDVLQSGQGLSVTVDFPGAFDSSNMNWGDSISFDLSGYHEEMTLTEQYKPDRVWINRAGIRCNEDVLQHMLAGATIYKETGPDGRQWLTHRRPISGKALTRGQPGDLIKVEFVTDELQQPATEGAEVVPSVEDEPMTQEQEAWRAQEESEPPVPRSIEGRDRSSGPRRAIPHRSRRRPREG